MTCYSSPSLATYGSAINITTPFTIYCNIFYNGSRCQRPQIAWYWNGISISNVSQISGGKDLNITSNVTLQATPPTVNYTCTVVSAATCRFAACFLGRLDRKLCENKNENMKYVYAYDSR
jgi:hypothetical protein